MAINVEVTETLSDRRSAYPTRGTEGASSTRIWEPFFRSEPSHADRGGGTQGRPGLAIVRGIVEAHGSTVAVISSWDVRRSHWKFRGDRGSGALGFAKQGGLGSQRRDFLHRSGFSRH